MFLCKYPCTPKHILHHMTLCKFPCMRLSMLHRMFLCMILCKYPRMLRNSHSHYLLTVDIHWQAYSMVLPPKPPHLIWAVRLSLLS